MFNYQYTQDKRMQKAVCLQLQNVHLDTNMFGKYFGLKREIKKNPAALLSEVHSFL